MTRKTGKRLMLLLAILYLVIVFGGTYYSIRLDRNPTGTVVKGK